MPKGNRSPKRATAARGSNFFFRLCGLLWILGPIVIVAEAAGIGIGHTYLVAACVWTAVCLVLMIGRFRTIHHSRHYDVHIDRNHYTETTWHGSESYWPPPPGTTVSASDQSSPHPVDAPEIVWDNRDGTWRQRRPEDPAGDETV